MSDNITMLHKDLRDLTTKIVLATGPNAIDRADVLTLFIHAHALVLSFAAGPNLTGASFDKLIRITSEELERVATESHQKAMQFIKG